MKLEDAVEAATLAYEELLVQKQEGGGGPDAEALQAARQKRDDLRRQLADHKATHVS
jgi:hypothetical protein